MLLKFVDFLDELNSLFVERWDFLTMAESVTEIAFHLLEIQHGILIAAIFGALEGAAKRSEKKEEEKPQKSGGHAEPIKHPPSIGMENFFERRLIATLEIP